MLPLLREGSSPSPTATAPSTGAVGMGRESESFVRKQPDRPTLGSEIDLPLALCREAPGWSRLAKHYKIGLEKQKPQEAGLSGFCVNWTAAGFRDWGFHSKPHCLIHNPLVSRDSS